MPYYFLLKLAYEGTRYLGYQRTCITAPCSRTIEGCLTIVLERLFQSPIEIEAASRTDAGVHACGQVVRCCVQNDFEPKKLLLALNQQLPRDIRVLTVKRTTAPFHPTLAAIGKEYHYYVCPTPVLSPLQRLYCWHYPSLLDLEKMRQGATLLTGTHNFKAFCNHRIGNPADTTRTVRAITLEQAGSQLVFRVRGERFLYKMVRNLVGTLVYIGCGKIPLETIPRLLQEGKRAEAGITAPSLGLFLSKVEYFEDPFI